MAFTTDFSEVQEFADFKAKEYEMIVFDAYEEENKDGTNKAVVIDYVVRNDVDQDKQNAHLWDRQWRSKETGKYHMGFLMGKAKALGIPEGKKYNNMEEFLADFKGRAAKIKVKLEEYNGQEYPRVQYTNATAFPQINHEWKEAPAGAGLDIQDDDLPF